MSQKESVYHALNERLWIVEGGVHPFREPELLTLGKVGEPSQSRGDATRITAPDPNNFEKDFTVGRVPGTLERATVTIGRRYTAARARLLQLFRKGCRVDLFVMAGKCGNAQDFINGGDKFVYFADGLPSSHDFENFGAYGKDESNPTNENLPMTAEEYWEFMKMGMDEVAAALTTREIMTVDVCDDVSCGDCGRESGGCNRVLATMAGVGATPGTVPLLLYSDDSGVSFSSQNITTLFSTESVADGECIGGDLVLISNEGNEIHYTNVNDIYTGENEWFETTSGFVVGGEPNSITSCDPSNTWICGNGGYIYYTRNHQNKVTVQDAGVATTEDLRCIHAMDRENILAVGDNNAVVFSNNGGDIWASVTGPAVGIDLSTCWMWSEDVWFIGEGAGGNGKLWATQDGGFTWSELDIPDNILRIDSLKFASEAEAFMSVRVGGNGRMLHTITAGNIWSYLPDKGKGTIPANDYMNDIAVCQKDSGIVFAGGLDDDATTGILIKGEG